MKGNALILLGIAAIFSSATALASSNILLTNHANNNSIIDEVSSGYQGINDGTNAAGNGYNQINEVYSSKEAQRNHVDNDYPDDLAPNKKIRPDDGKVDKFDTACLGDNCTDQTQHAVIGNKEIKGKDNSTADQAHRFTMCIDGRCPGEIYRDTTSVNN